MIAKRWGEIQSCVATAREGAPLAAASVTVVAACKGQTEAALDEALTLGVTDFGENRVQEAERHWATRRARLHFIGALQSNKAEEAVALFDYIHSLDRESLCDALARAMEKQGRRVGCFIQVNTGEEPQKSGVLPGVLPSLLAYARKLELPVVGLMCVPPAEALKASHFAFLHLLAREHGLQGLSMGMSDDYPLAIRFGATHVRIGTALFGPR